jgi:hypothetical protein
VPDDQLGGVGANRPSPPRDLTDYPVGVPEIVALLHALGWPTATKRTVMSWIERARGGPTHRRPHPFPAAEPTKVCGGSWWWASTIEAWLITTGRLHGPIAPSR